MRTRFPATDGLSWGGGAGARRRAGEALAALANASPSLSIRVHFPAPTGVSVIALWLGHEAVESTRVYLHADMQIKKNAINQTRPTDVPEGTFRPDDELMAFLEAL